MSLLLLGAGPSSPVPAVQTPEVLAQYTITGDVLTPTTEHAGIDAGALTNASLSNFLIQNVGYSTGTVVSPNPASGATTAATAVTNNSYFSFTLTPTEGNMSLSSLTFKGARGGASTPRGYALRSSIDSYAANIATADFATQRTTWPASDITVDLSGAAFQDIGAITFRMYIYTPGTGSSVDLDDITVNGIAIEPP